MKRKRTRSPFPLVLLLLALAVLVIGLWIRGSGLLVNMGLVDSGLPEGLDAPVNDNRIEEFHEAAAKGPSLRVFYEDLIRILSNEPKEGILTVQVTDDRAGFGIADVALVLTSAEGQVLERLVTDQTGTATTGHLPYRQAYRLSVAGMPHPYKPSDESVFLAMRAPETAIAFTGRVRDHVKAYTDDGAGGAVPTEVYIDVPQLLQKPELPNGCEITALASALQAEGYGADKEVLSDEYLAKSPFVRKGGTLYGGDPEEVFAGDPRDGGSFYVFTAPVVEAARAYIADAGGQHTVTDLTGAPPEALIDSLERGVPVVVWVTLDLSPVVVNYRWTLHDTDTVYEAITNLHALVIHGYDETTLDAMDPLAGPMAYDRELFFASYEDMGRRALVVERPER